MEAIILSTVWDPKYFEVSKEAPYKNFDYRAIENWENIKSQLVIPAIGIYKRDHANINFVFLKIMGMRYDETNSAYFDFRVIQKSTVSSSTLINLLPQKNKSPLFSSIDLDGLIKIIKATGAIIPDEWIQKTSNSKDTTTTPTHQIQTVQDDFLSYIGKHYQKLLSSDISNDEFEDITANLLVALRFDVKQQGHNVIAAKADGIAFFENDFGIVYDCKNQNNFVLTADYERAINRYLEDEKLVNKVENLFPVFIVKGFRQIGNSNIKIFEIESLLYLLYKKLTLGNKFSLSPLKVILRNNIQFTLKTIDIEWR